MFRFSRHKVFRIVNAVIQDGYGKMCLYQLMRLMLSFKILFRGLK